MLTTKDGYKLHIAYIDSRLEKFNARLEQVTKDKEYLFKVISDFADVYAKGNLDITELTYSNRGNFNIRSITKYNFGEHTELLRNYILSYINALKIEYNCLILIKQYALLKVPVEFYKFASIELNVEYSREILLGSSMDLSHGVGCISINEKERNFNDATTFTAVDWKTSKQVKEQLIKDGITPYDKVNAPNGTKWQVKHTEDFTYWWWWKYRAGINNASFFKFVPTKFINGAARNIKEFAKTFNTIETILESKLLGNIDKLHKIKQLYPAYLLNYKETLET